MTFEHGAELIAVVAFLFVLLGSRVLRRLLLTTAVIIRYVTLGLGARIAGRRGIAPELVRRAFEDLGPTYIKLGQIIASSHGLFPRSFVEEFSKCLDRVRPFPVAEVERTLQSELGRPMGDLFSRFDPVPVASASIAQVHGARLPSGEDVVIKVQRPHIRERVDADVAILRVGARLLSLVPTAELANPTGIIDDFDATIHEEIDFVGEAERMEEFNRIMGELGHTEIAAPRVFTELTTERVLVMERFYGVRIDDVDAIRAQAVDAEERLILGLRAWFQCLILYGFFHGDVHAGNLMLLNDKRLGFLDFGIIGRFSEEQRIQVTKYIIAFVTGDYRRLGEVMVAMGSVEEGVDLDSLAEDLKEAYAPLRSKSVGELKYAELIPSVLRTAVKHHMRLPKEFVLVTKQMFYFDRYAKLLAPGLSIFTDPRLAAGLGSDILRAKELLKF